MDRKIAKKEVVEKIIKEVVEKRKVVDSQEELAELVLRKLRKIDERYVLSPTRAKRIALNIPEIEVKARTKKTIKLASIDRCPVCESEIEPVTVKNLVGRDVVIGYRCTKCGYESDLEAFMPMKYLFIWKG